MAKFTLNIGEDIKESFLFWLTRYLLYKTTTLDNSKADKELLQEAIRKTRPTPQDLSDLLEIARDIKKSGIGIYTLFHPVWLFVKENSGNANFTQLEDIDEESVIQWLSIATSSKSEATKKTYRTALQDFFNYLSRYNDNNHHFDMDLSKWQKNLKNALNKPPAFLSEDEVDLFIDGLYELVLHKQKKDEVNVVATSMYRLLFKLALASGLRVSELVNLKMKDMDIDSSSDTITISVLNSKGNKSRFVVVPYSKGRLAIKCELDDYLEVRDCSDECKEYLFCGNKGKKLQRYTPDKVLRAYLAQIGIKKEKMGMHLLRHTHASLFYSKTIDPVLLQDRLGHSDPQTTRRYIHLEEEKVRKSADAMR